MNCGYGYPGYLGLFYRNPKAFQLLLYLVEVLRCRVYLVDFRTCLDVLSPSFDSLLEYFLLGDPVRRYLYVTLPLEQVGDAA